MIKAVLLDVDNTLIDFNECAKAAMKMAFSDFRLTFEENMISVFLEVNDYLWHEIEKQCLTKDELYKIRWNMIFDRLKIEADGVRFEECFLKYLAKQSHPVEDAYDLLEYLSQKYILCIVSNAPYNQQMSRLDNANMLHYFEHIFISEKIGHSKPGKAFFDACFLKLKDILPNEVMIIGDSENADIGGGNAYGLKTCWYNHNHKEIPKDLQADFIVNSLSEVKDII